MTATAESEDALAHADETRVLAWAAVAALFGELAVLVVVGTWNHWLAHPHPTSESERFIEAEVFQPPPEAHLVDEKKPTVPQPEEKALAKRPDQGRKAKPDEGKLAEENQTNAGPPPLATHGPVVVFSPAPVIPEYLRDQNLRTSVVIDFFVTAQGAVTPRLVGTSGNEELDAIALAAVRKWQFRPAENEHKAIDAKVRLRIVFEVK